MISSLINHERSQLFYMSKRYASTLGRAPDEAAIRKLRCSQILMDRYQPLVFQPQMSFGSHGWFAQKRIRLGAYIKSARASAMIRNAEKEFSPSSFMEKSQNILFEFMLGLSTGNIPVDACTETLSESIKKYKVPVSKMFGTPLLSTIKSINESEYLQARVVQVADTSNMSFGQVTMRFLADAKIVTETQFKEEAKGNSEARSWLKAKDSPITEPTGFWKIAFDTKGEYYYNSFSNKTTWVRPPNYLISPVFFTPARGTLGNCGRVITDPDSDGYFKAEYIVTFERPLFNLRVPWRIAHF